MITKIIAIPVLLLVSALLCASADRADAAGAAAVRFRFPPATLDMTCREVAAFYPVPADLARKVVPERFNLQLNPDGTATLGLITQECANITMDKRIRTGKAGFVHVWIAVEGPFEIDPVPGTVTTWPTMYWYSFRDQSDNLLLTGFAMLSGIQVEPIRSLTLGGVDAGIRNGKVVERYRPEVDYSWNETSQVQPAVSIGINHRFYRDQSGWPVPTTVAARIRCTIQLGGQGVSFLTAHPRSVIADMDFPTTLQGMTYDFTMGCRANLQATPSEE